MIDGEVDYIVLGCTHYPLLSNQINKITGGNISLLEPSEAIAKQVQKKLEEFDLESQLKNRKTLIYTSGNNISTVKTVLDHLKIKETENIEVKRYF